MYYYKLELLEREIIYKMSKRKGILSINLDLARSYYILL